MQFWSFDGHTSSSNVRLASEIKLTHCDPCLPIFSFMDQVSTPSYESPRPHLLLDFRLSSTRNSKKYGAYVLKAGTEQTTVQQKEDIVLHFRRNVDFVTLKD